MAGNVRIGTGTQPFRWMPDTYQGRERMKIGTIAVGTLTLALAAPGSAQDNPAGSGDSVFDGDYLSVGVGAAYGPSYDGSDDYVLYPAALLQGRKTGKRGPGE